MTLQEAPLKPLSASLGSATPVLEVLPPRPPAGAAREPALGCENEGADTQDLAAAGTSRAGSLARRAGRGLAMLLLPLSIAPVIVLGPGLVHAPQRLYRQGRAEAQRVARALAPGRPFHELPVLGPVEVSHQRLTHLAGAWSGMPWVWQRSERAAASAAPARAHESQASPFRLFGVALGPAPLAVGAQRAPSSGPSPIAHVPISHVPSAHARIAHARIAHAPIAHAPIAHARRSR